MLHIDIKYTQLLQPKLRNFRRKDNFLFNFSCPLCGDSKRNTRKARGYVYRKGNDLFYRCHNCGAGTTLGNLVKMVDPNLHRQYLLEQYKESGDKKTPSETNKKQTKIPTVKFGKVSQQKSFTNAEPLTRLPKGHFCLDYVRNREIPEKHFERLFFTNDYKALLDELYANHGKPVYSEPRLVIPFYDQYNALIGVSGRAFNNTNKNNLRYVTLKLSPNEEKMIYGMERVDLSKPVYVVEGPLDSLFLDNAVASGDSSLLQTAKSIDAGRKIIVFDNERRNSDIIKQMRQVIKQDFPVCIWPLNIPEKDINEMIMGGIPIGEIQKIIDRNTFSGLEAMTRLNFWKRI